MTRKISTSREFFDSCIEGLFDWDGENQAVREVGGVRVGLRLVRGGQPRVEETYAVLAPWSEAWGDVGEVMSWTPVPRALLDDPALAAAAVAGVRDRVEAMATWPAIAKVSLEVVAGRDTRFGEMELPGDFMKWVTIGVWAKILEDGPLTYDGVQGLLDVYTLALRSYFSRTRRGVGWSQGSPDNCRGGGRDECLHVSDGDDGPRAIASIRDTGELEVGDTNAERESRTDSAAVLPAPPGRLLLARPLAPAAASRGSARQYRI